MLLTFTEHRILVDTNLVARDDQGVQGQPCQDRNDHREHDAQSKATLSVFVFLISYCKGGGDRLASKDAIFTALLQPLFVFLFLSLLDGKGQSEDARSYCAVQDIEGHYYMWLFGKGGLVMNSVSLSD